MRRYNQYQFSAVAGVLLCLTCSFRLALIFAAVLLVVLGWSICRR
jgi:hypothetical protein